MKAAVNVTIEEAIKVGAITHDHWLAKAETEDAIVTINSDKSIHWWSGAWLNGTWEGGTWWSGTWEDGTWEGGTWKEGYWKYGLWLDGEWEDGVWLGGTWTGGHWTGGTWKDGNELAHRGWVHLKIDGNEVIIDHAMNRTIKVPYNLLEMYLKGMPHPDEDLDWDTEWAHDSEIMGDVLEEWRGKLNEIPVIS